MIENKEVAQNISDLMIDFGGRINQSLVLVQNKCSNDEFEKYRDAASMVKGEMLLKIMNPIYEAHPEIKPKELD